MRKIAYHQKSVYGNTTDGMVKPNWMFALVKIKLLYRVSFFSFVRTIGMSSYSSINLDYVTSCFDEKPIKNPLIKRQLKDYNSPSLTYKRIQSSKRT